MRILLIGGRGFIGPFVIGILRRAGHEAILFDRGSRPNLYSELEHIKGDRRRIAEYAAAFRKAKPDVVIDLVLSSGRQASELMSTFKGIARRVVALSSMDVYRACGVLHGLEPGPLEPMPLTEDSPLRTRLQTYPPERIQMLKKVLTWLDDEYDKIPVERAVMAEPDLPGTVLRLPFVYGPGDFARRLSPILKRVDDGRKVIQLDEEVSQFRGPRGYVENVATAIATAATDDRAARRIYNVAEPVAFTELEWTEKVAKTAGWQGEILVVPSERGPAHLKPPGNWKQHWAADSSRIRRELGYRETVPLREALEATIRWERANPLPVDEKQFDYAAEDAYLRDLPGRAS
jgi:nucleoside-diphosphate-sugar epimerase